MTDTEQRKILDGDHKTMRESQKRSHYARGCRHEACVKARSAWAREYYRAKQAHTAPQIPKEPSRDSVRRLRALVAAGWTPARLAERLGVETDTLWWLLLTPPAEIRTRTVRRIETLWKRLRYDDPPSRTRAHQSDARRARLLAEFHGWPRWTDTSYQKTAE